MNESGIYTESDLKPYQARLRELKMIIKEGDPENLSRDSEERRGTTEEVEEELERDKAMTKLMYEKWDACGKFTTYSPPFFFSLPLHQTDRGGTFGTM